MNVTAKLSDVAKVRTALQARTVAMLQGVQRTVQDEAANLAAYVINDKLADQVLKLRSDRLQRSITSAANDNGNTFGASIGSNLAYARALEYGFNGTVEVKECERMQTMAFGRQMADPHLVAVRAHSMQMNLAAHPFMQPALQENSGRIVDNLRRALMEALQC
jgi:phage gpG-like protein